MVSLATSSDAELRALQASKAERAEAVAINDILAQLLTLNEPNREHLMEPKLAITVRRVADKVAALEINGELTRLAEAPLTAAYAEAVGLAARTIILDLGGLAYMNNKGMGLLVKLEAQARREGRQLVAAGLNDHYRRVFRMTGLDEGIPVFSDVAQVTAAQ